MKVYVGSLKHVDWTNLDAVKVVARALDAVVILRPDYENYQIVPTLEQAHKTGAKIVWHSKMEAN